MQVSDVKSPTTQQLIASSTKSNTINSVSRVLLEKVNQQQPKTLGKPAQPETMNSNQPSGLLLIPLGIALHHLLDSHDLASLYHGIRSECLKEIRIMILKIEA